jgi:iron complex outermembrane recepter protein
VGRQRFAPSGDVSLTVTLLVAALAHSVGAQEIERLDEIVVSALRIGQQDIQQVPMAVSALKPNELNALGLENVSDLVGLVPSLAITQDGVGQIQYAIRGIADPGGVNANNLEDQSLVAVYLDDAPLALQSATPDLKVFDLDRIEVIRGPQGTIYGVGAMAGTIRYITIKPDPGAWSGYSEGVYSNTTGYGSNYSVRSMLNAPLIQGALAARVSAYQGRDTGFIDDIGDGERATNSVLTSQARGALRFVASPAVTVDASLTYSDVREGGGNGVYTGLGNGYDETDNLTQQYYDDRLTASNATVNADLPFAHFVSSSSFLNRDFAGSSSFQALVAELVFGHLSASPDYTGNHLTDFTQEIRFHSLDAAPVHWIGGLFYDTSNRHFLENDITPGLDAFTQTYAVAYGAPIPNDIFYGNERVRQHQGALFAEATYPILAPLEVTLGARYFIYRQTYDLYTAGIAGALGPGMPQVQDASGRESGTNPRGVLTYHVTPDVLVFAEAAKGVRFGGINKPVPFSLCDQALEQAGFSNAPLTYAPDHLWSYSLGEKANFDGGRVWLNLTGFYIDWNEVQTAHQLNCGYSIVENAGRVTSKGGEIEARARVTPALTVSVAGDYTNASSAEPIPNLSAPAGAPVPYFPRYSASVTAEYRIALAQTRSLKLAVVNQYRSSEWNDFDPLTRYNVSGGDRLDSAITFVTGALEMGLFGNNLTDSHLLTDGGINVYGRFAPGDGRAVIRPRTVGLRAAYHY